MNFFQEWWNSVWNHLSGNYGPGASAGSIASSGSWDVIGDSVTNFFKGVGNFGQNTWNGIKDVGSAVGDWFKDMFSSPTSNGTPAPMSGTGSLVQDSESNAISELASRLNVELNDDTKDYLYQYFFQNELDKDAWARTMEADNSRYQRTVEDLRKAGLNPFLALGSAGSVGGSSSGSIVGGLGTQKANNYEDNKTKRQVAMMSVLAIIASGLIKALA